MYIQVTLKLKFLKGEARETAADPAFWDGEHVFGSMSSDSTDTVSYCICLFGAAI